MTLASILRAQLATGRPLRVTRALLEALVEPPAIADDLRMALCKVLDLSALVSGRQIVETVQDVVNARDEARRERDEVRRELAHRPTMIAHMAACRERDEARAEVERLRAREHKALVTRFTNVDADIREAEERGAVWALEAWHRDELQTGPAREEAARICDEARKAPE